MIQTSRILAIALLGTLPSLALAQGASTFTVDTPSGPIEATQRSVEPTPQKIEIALKNELRALRSQGLRANAFVTGYLPGVTKPTPKDVDEAFRRWQRDPKPRHTEKQVVEMLGAWIGERLVADLQMEWVIVTDATGRDYAVRAKQKELMAFPFASVENRMERKENGFAEGLYYVVRQMVEGGEGRER